jgi:hypothetical protein
MQRSMFKFHAEYALASESGDYFQVLFEEKQGAENGRYFLLQRQFEFPDECQCAIETELPEMCGHIRVQRAVLEPGRFQISWIGRGVTQAEITFAPDDNSYGNICRIMRIMIPEVDLSPLED